MKLRTRLPIIIPPVPPYGDEGPFEAIIEPHPYLLCACGHRLWEGETFDGAWVLACRACQRIVDERRVA